MSSGGGGNEDSEQAAAVVIRSYTGSGSYTKCDGKTLKGFTEMLALSELPLMRSLAHPLGGEWAAEELGWRQGTS